MAMQAAFLSFHPLAASPLSPLWVPPPTCVRRSTAPLSIIFVMNSRSDLQLSSRNLGGWGGGEEEVAGEEEVCRKGI
jgi:hypothetical protein